MHVKAKMLLPLFIAVGLLTSAEAQGTYTQFDVPGAASTRITAINSAGDIVGNYTDNTGGHGFLLQGSTLTTIDYPGVTHTYVQGLNDNGQVVGYSGPGGFLYDISTQAFTLIKYPGASATYALAINNSGVIAGYLRQNGVHTGFELSNGTFLAIRYHGATSTIVFGITANNWLVGTSDVPPIGQDFIFQQGRFQPLSIGPTPSSLTGINPQASALVGTYETFSGTKGFLYSPKLGSLITISFPGALDTDALAINSAGTVVGYFIDSSSKIHGFTWTQSN